MLTIGLINGLMIELIEFTILLMLSLYSKDFSLSLLSFLMIFLCFLFNVILCNASINKHFVFDFHLGLAMSDLQHGVIWDTAAYCYVNFRDVNVFCP